MKTNMKLKLAATAAAVLATGLLSQSAKADTAALNTQYDATLEEMNIETPINYQGDTFVLRSEATAVTGGYLYQYDFGVTDAQGKNGPQVGLASLSVYFDTLGTSPTGASGAAYTGVMNSLINPLTPTSPAQPASPQVVAGDVNWTFNPVSTEEIVSFVSTFPPGFGSASAQNGGLWSQISTDPTLDGIASLVVVPVVPAVPDTATTLSLLGGALVGLGALRRKIGC